MNYRYDVHRVYLQKVVSKKKLKETFFSVGIFEVTDEKSRIRIHTKMSRIRNTDHRTVDVENKEDSDA